MPLAATWMGAEIVRHNRVSQTEKDKYRIICGIQKNGTVSYLQSRNKVTDVENKLMVTKVERWEKAISQELVTVVYT